MWVFFVTSVYIFSLTYARFVIHAEKTQQNTADKTQPEHKGSDKTRTTQQITFHVPKLTIPYQTLPRSTSDMQDPNMIAWLSKYRQEPVTFLYRNVR